MLNKPSGRIMEISCKYCSSTDCTKNGKVRSMQRYKCKSCGHNFVLGDKREKVKISLERNRSGKLSVDRMAKISRPCSKQETQCHQNFQAQSSTSYLPLYTDS